MKYTVANIIKKIKKAGIPITIDYKGGRKIYYFGGTYLDFYKASFLRYAFGDKDMPAQELINEIRNQA